MPKGSLLKQYHPNGIMKVVNKRDSLLSGICQKLLLASNLLNTVAPVVAQAFHPLLDLGVPL